MYISYQRKCRYFLSSQNSLHSLHASHRLKQRKQKNIHTFIKHLLNHIKQSPTMTTEEDLASLFARCLSLQNPTYVAPKEESAPAQAPEAEEYTSSGLQIQVIEAILATTLTPKQSTQNTKNMVPINWDTGIHTNRPSQHSTQHSLDYYHSPRPHHNVIPFPNPAPAEQRVRQIPTAYYLEQAPFYAEYFGPDPYATEPEVIRPGPLKIFVYALLSLFSSPLSTIKNFFLALATAGPLLAVFNFVSSGLLAFVKLVCGHVADVHWDVFVAMALANVLVKLLPEIGGEIVMKQEVDEPVYTLFVKGGEAIGSGAVGVRNCVGSCF